MIFFFIYNKLKPEKSHRQKTKEKGALYLNVKSKHYFLWDYFTQRENIFRTTIRNGGKEHMENSC